MKSFLQMLLASFGVLTLVLAGCSTQGGEEEVIEGDDAAVLEDSSVVEDDASMADDAAVINEAASEEVTE